MGDEGTFASRLPNQVQSTEIVQFLQNALRIGGLLSNGAMAAAILQCNPEEIEEILTGEVGEGKRRFLKFISQIVGIQQNFPWPISVVNSPQLGTFLLLVGGVAFD